MKQQDKLLVVVLGMHRSGTSAITRALQVLGVDLGHRLMAPAPGNNEKGFFEDLDVVNFNIELLKACGREWSDLVPPPEGELLSEAFAFLLPKAIELLREKLEGKDVFALKDPRFSVLLPFWLRVFEHLKLNVAYVISVRNPLSVARSLERRDQFAPERSHYLWLQHVVPSVVLTVGAPRVVVDYDRLMDDPEEQIRRIAKALALESRLDGERLAEFRERFLEESLRHAHFGADDPLADPLVPDPVRIAARALGRVSVDELDFESSEVAEIFGNLALQIREMAPAMACVMRSERLVEELKRSAVDQATQIEMLERDFADQRAQIDRFALALADRAEQIDSLRKAIAERDRQVAVLEEVVRQREDLIQRWSIS